MSNDEMRISRMLREERDIVRSQIRDDLISWLRERHYPRHMVNSVMAKVRSVTNPESPIIEETENV